MVYIKTASHKHELGMSIIQYVNDMMSMILCNFFIHLSLLFRIVSIILSQCLISFVLFLGSYFGRGDSSHRHRDRSSHPGNHSLCVWQLHHPNYRPSSQHSDELQQGHGPGQRPGVYKGNMTDCVIARICALVDSFPS